MHIRKVPHLILPERQETTQLISVASQLPISQIGRHSILVSWQFRFLFILTKVELTSSVQVKVLLQLQRYRQPTIPGTHQPTHIDTKTTSALTPFVTVAPSDELGSLRTRNYHHVKPNPSTRERLKPSCVTPRLINKLVKLRRCVSQVHSTRIHLGHGKNCRS